MKAIVAVAASILTAAYCIATSAQLLRCGRPLPHPQTPHAPHRSPRLSRRRSPRRVPTCTRGRHFFVAALGVNVSSIRLSPLGRSGRTRDESASCLPDGSSLSAAMHELSERAKERQEVHLLPGRERREPIACRAPLTVVREDRVLDRARAPVVQEGGQEPKAPERRGTHLATGRFSLLDAVAQTSHVVDQEIGIRLEGTESQGRDIARAGPERANVAVRAPDLLEKAAPFIRAIRPPAAGEVPTGSNVD